MKSCEDGGFPMRPFLVSFKNGYEVGAALSGPLVSGPSNLGMHGYVPERPELRSSFFIVGPPCGGRPVAGRDRHAADCADAREHHGNLVARRRVKPAGARIAMPPGIGYPTLSQIQLAAERLSRKDSHEHPCGAGRRHHRRIVRRLHRSLLKLELFQRTGTFKLRGALNCAEALDATARGSRRGRPSAREIMRLPSLNTAKLLGITAKVVMPQHASPARIALCKELGAEVILVARCPSGVCAQQTNRIRGSRAP